MPLSIFSQCLRATISLSFMLVHKPASRSSGGGRWNSVLVCHGALKSIIVATEQQQKATVRWRLRLRACRAVSTAVKEQDNRPCAVMVSALDCLASFVKRNVAAAVCRVGFNLFFSPRLFFRLFYLYFTE